MLAFYRINGKGDRFKPTVHTNCLFLICLLNDSLAYDVNNIVCPHEEVRRSEMLVTIL